MTWNGTNITGPVLIYQNELVVDDSDSPTATSKNGILICKDQARAQVGWHSATGSSIHENNKNHDFRQIRTGPGMTPSVSRLSVNEDVSRNDTVTNGLWTCRLNGSASVPTPFPVGIYNRAGGE